MTAIILTALISVISSVLVIKFAFNKKASTAKLAEYQLKLAEMDDEAKLKYGLDWDHYASDEMDKESKAKKSWALIFGGFGMTFIMLIYIMFDKNLTVVGSIVVAAFVFILAGMINFGRNAGRTWFAIILIIIILAIGIMMKYGFEILIQKIF